MFADEDLRLEPYPAESEETVYQLTLAASTEMIEDRQSIPEDLDEMEPGPYLAATLSSLDLSRLSGDDVVTSMRAQQRLISHDQAGLCAAMVETAHCVAADTTERSPVIEDFAPEEIGAALTLTRRMSNDELGVAFDLDSRLPQVARAMRSGDLDARKARILSRDTAHLDSQTANEVVDVILPEAPSLTTGQIRARLRKLCIEADPADAMSRYERSLTERKVVAEENAEGTAAFIISQASPQDVLAARDHVNRLAKRLKSDDDPRNIDQIRADHALALLQDELSGSGKGHGGTVTMTASISTLAELDQMPGDLGGYGPVIAEVARKVARQQEDGEWTAVVTDDETGEPLHVVSVRRRPTAQQLRKIRALMPTCSWPGCRMPATDSDIDHIDDRAAGGPTTVRNQAPLCRRHHMAKHRGGVAISQDQRQRVGMDQPAGPPIPGEATALGVVGVDAQ
jgi:hypothetical protein